MKKWLSVAAVVVLCLALVIGIACGGGDGDEEGVKKLKFGIGVPMTGAGGAVAGLPFKWSLEMAEEKIGEFEVGGERYVWDFIVEDDQCNVAGGHASANKLIYDHGVDFIEYNCSDSGLAAAMITEEIGMINIIGNCSLFDVGPDLPHTFVNILIYDLDTPALFDYIAKEHPEVKRVAVIYNEMKSGLALRDAAKACCDYYGLEVKSATTPELVVEYYPVATKLMAYDPDLVIGSLSLFKVMWELGYEGLSASNWWSEAGHGAVPWDKAAGKTFVYQPHPMPEPWPEVAPWAVEYEDRYGVEVQPGILFGLLLPDYMTQALEKAGTVTDMDRIIEVLETETFDTAVGPLHFGGEEIIGIPRILMQPQPIWKVVGPGEYEVVAQYTAEELEELANEIYAGR